jgi:RNA polymerase sigma-70 factor (ECF subfamily)
VDERAAAIEELYRARYVAFRNGIATVTGSYETARDVVQEAFARAWRDRTDFRGDGSLEGWIWRIAFRIALDGRRNGTRSGPPAALEPELVEPERDPALAAALRRLPPRKRLFVFLRYFADLSYAQIADVCRVSEGTVAAALAQARTTLHEEMTTKGSPR